MLLIRIVNRNDYPEAHEKGNYTYTVLVNNRAIETGKLEGFTRRRGWRELAYEVLDKGHLERRPRRRARRRKRR